MKGSKKITMLKLRSLPLCVLASAIFCTSAAMAQRITPSVRIVNPIDESQLVTLKGAVHPLANARNDRGAAPESLQLQRMHLVLKRSAAQETALRQLIGQMHAPGNPGFHKWLTPDQFGAEFGPSDQDIATVETWLAGHGFNVAKVSPGKLTIEFSGNAAQLRSAFHTQIHQYMVNGETRYANANNPQIPAALAPVVGGFVSLNNFRLQRYGRYLGKAAYDPATGTAAPQWTIGGGTASTDTFVLAPADFYAQYDLNNLYNAGTKGSGQTIAIVNDSNINIALVNQFRTLFGLPANPPQVIIDGNDPGIDGINNPDGPSGDSSEAYIDVEWAGAVAPQATVDLVIGADTAVEGGLYLAAEHAVYGNIAPVISLSFGQCEAYDTYTDQFFNQLWEQAAAQGITVLVSSGDSGSAQCDNDNTQYYAQSGQNVSGFASTPFNVAVGGTDFYYSDYATGGASISNYWNTTTTNTTPGVSINTAKVPIPEQPWNDSQFGLNINSVYISSGNTETYIAAGAGGASAIYPKPSWQSLTIPGMPNDNARDLPDVSLFAANGLNKSYYPVCAVDGDCQPVSSGDTVQISGYGGTSVASPAFAGIMALVNQKYGRQGQADYILYPLYTQAPSAFRDVTVGTNSVPCELSPILSPNCIAAANPITLGTVLEGQIGAGTTPEYNAGPGYDLATGLGTVDAYNLVTNWNKVTLAHTSTTMAAIPAGSIPLTAIPHGTNIALSGTVTGAGTPTGDVSLLADSTEPVNQGQDYFTLSSGAYSTGTSPINFLPGGTYNIWAHYGGDSSNASSDSSPTRITVIPESSGIFFQGYTSNTSLSAGAPAVALYYGSQVLLSAQIAPSSQLAAFENCQTSGAACPSFTYPTGTVTFSDTSANSGLPKTAVINSEGDAEFNAPFSIGNHAVTATYSGDQSYNAVTSSLVSFQIVQDTPELLYGTPITTNTGQLLNGSGQPTVISLQVENGIQYTSSSATYIYPVPVAAPTGTLTYSSAPSGISGTLTLSPGTDPNTGAVEGVANIVIPAATASGTYTITVNYSGDSNYTVNLWQLPATAIVNVTGLASSIAATMTGSISPTSNITVSGTVTGQSGQPAPTGTRAANTGVGIYASGGGSPNSNYIGIAYLTPGVGDASSFSFILDSQRLPQGANLITLQYSGDSVYAPSALVLSGGAPISNPLSDFSMVPQATLVPVTAGSSTADTINLASINGFTGTVDLTCNAAPGVTCSIPSQGLSSGGSAAAMLTINAPKDTANQTYNLLITGTDPTGKFVHTLQVQAIVTGSTAGAQSFALTNSGDVTIAIIGNNGASTLTVMPIGGFTGPVSLSCAVTDTFGAANPATCTLGPDPGATSSTSVTITGTTAQTVTLTVVSTGSTTGGVYTVTVTGTGTNGASTALTLTTVVTANVGTPSFTLSNPNSTSGAPLTIATTGSTGSETVTVAPVNGFTGQVNLSCVVAAPAGANDPATCAWSGAGTSTSVTLGSGSQTATLQIYTTAATSLNKPMQLFWPSTGGAVLALLCFFLVPRRRRNGLALIALLVHFVSGAALGCTGGGGGGGGGGGSTANPGTTNGNYSVTVTAKSGSIVQTTPVYVTVN
jgi:hypothetical protein